jgi:hypothetical protein
MNESTCTIIKSGNKIWENPNGQFHRTDGPAIECTNGDKHWCINGQCHRTDGPAKEYADGDKEYWYRDEQITEEVFYSDEFQVRMVMQS